MPTAWTTGMLTVSLTGLGATVLITTGSDNRNAAGSGAISLVAGSITQRSLVGPTGGAGWMNLLVPEPGPAISTLVALTTLALCHRATRRLRAPADAKRFGA